MHANVTRSPLQAETASLLERLGGKEKATKEMDQLISEGASWRSFYERVAPILWPGNAKGDKTASDQKKCLNLYFNNRKITFSKEKERTEKKAERKAAALGGVEGAESRGTHR